MNAKDITIIEPTDARHRQLIQAAMKARDTHALALLKDNTHKPVWLISNWFMYGLIASSWESEAELQHVPIWLPQTRLDYARFDARRTNQPEPTISIPLNTYDFLL